MNKQINVLIVNSAEPEVTEFYQSIEKIIAPTGVTYKSVEYKDCLNINVDIYDGIIITGSPQGDDIVEHHQPYFQWVKTYKKPVMGICAGHHVIGNMYGAEYLYSKEPESGKTKIELIAEDPIFDQLPKELAVHQMHNDSITLPKKFIHLAKSTVCVNQAMKHQDKAIYTFQFHPEYYNHKLFFNFIKLL